jgi:hypothetical protein
MKKLVDSSKIDSHGDSRLNGTSSSNGDRANRDNGASNNDSITEYDYELPTWQELTLILVSWSECGEVGDVKGFLKATM